MYVCMDFFFSFVVPRVKCNIYIFNNNKKNKILLRGPIPWIVSFSFTKYSHSFSWIQHIGPNIYQDLLKFKMMFHSLCLYY